MAPKANRAHEGDPYEFLEFPMRCILAWLFHLTLVLTSPVMLALASAASAADGTPPFAGLRENTPTVHALVGARIVTAPGAVIEQGTIVLREGVITHVGAEVAIPADARRHDLAGRTIYPGLFDAYSEFAPGREALQTAGGAPYWNGEVVPQYRVAAHFRSVAGDNAKWRSQGVALRLAAPAHRVIKGTSAVVDTGDGDGAQSILLDDVALHLRLNPETRRRGEDGYPGSPMGAVALVRQAFYDADWHRRAWQAHLQGEGVPRPERNDALAALEGYSGDRRRVMIDAPDELYFLRADAVAREFRLNTIVRGSGDEYRRLDAIAATGRPVIVPVNFPSAPDVRTPEDARQVSLERLMDWDHAPENPGRLAAAGVTIALTSHGLRDRGEFLASVRKAVERGLDPIDALRALSTTPAELYGVADRVGTIQPGKLAYLTVTDGDLFAKQTKVLTTWIAGRPYDVSPPPLVEPRGTWTVELDEEGGKKFSLVLKVTGEPKKLAGEIREQAKSAKLGYVELEDARLAFHFQSDPLGWEGIVRASGVISGETISGTGLWSDGHRFTFDGQRTEPAASAPETAQAPNEAPPNEATAVPEKRADDEAEEQLAAAQAPRRALFPVNFPLGAAGRSAPPEQPPIVAFTGGTVWTAGREGTLPQANLLVRAGKVVAVGRDIDIPAGALVVDVTGKHLTPGLIDCHSHSATDGGINEATQSITAEVRIGDFIDADDINIHRQLAGGITTINVLHGSANTIGGQNAVLKLRWGALPEEMKFAQAPAGIKFALGENVKQSNWPNANNRYPQTRMGVPELVDDAFRAAREYRAAWTRWRPGLAELPPRVDLELEALAEILAGERLIHCHSYRQDEILAFLRVCERHGVRVATLQHVLEGFKVAEVIAAHGAGASSFSDWWAYKFEVYDAIPFNGALLHRAGVLVTFNSDSAELARRMNAEAAKAVKYGDVPETEALKFVTHNVARQLGIDAWVGALEPGRDADLVIWSGPPLSTLSICEQTWIDGRRYFDRAEDLTRRAENERMRAALIQRVLDSGESTGDSHKDAQNLWDREDIYCHAHGAHDDRQRGVQLREQNHRH
jgi:imidazolonepropionase-like amidohydrolase